MEIYLTAEVPMGINIDQLRVQRNRYQMTPSTVLGAQNIKKSTLLSIFVPFYWQRNKSLVTQERLYVVVSISVSRMVV